MRCNCKVYVSRPVFHSRKTALLRLIEKPARAVGGQQKKLVDYYVFQLWRSLFFIISLHRVLGSSKTNRRFV